MSYMEPRMTPASADPLSGVVARWVIFMFVLAMAIGAIMIGGRALAIEFAFRPVLFVLTLALFSLGIWLLLRQFQRGLDAIARSESFALRMSVVAMAISMVTSFTAVLCVIWIYFSLHDSFDHLQAKELWPQSAPPVVRLHKGGG